MTQGAMTATHSERDELLGMLERSRERFLASIAGVEEVEAGVHAREGSWSILEITEHVTIAEAQMLKAFVKLGRPGTGNRELDQKLPMFARDRTRKGQSPEGSLPKGRFATLDEARAKFVANRANTMEFLRGLNEDLRAKIVPHPIGGDLDGYQLFLIMALHPERHAAQVNEVKAQLRGESE